MKTRNEFPDFLSRNNCKIGIEIGSYKGQYAKILLDNWQGHLYMVDVWRKMDESEYVDASNQENPSKIISEVFENLKEYENRTTLIRTDSHLAKNLFPDEFFDFIYIDANHRCEYVKNDLIDWYPKLKVGGIFAGHDYISDYSEEFSDENGDVHVWIHNNNTPEISEYAGLFGVNKAVKEFCEYINADFETTTDEYFSTWYFKKGSK